MDGFDVVRFIAWLLTGGGCGVIAYLIVDKIPALSNLLPDYKRYVSFAITGVLAALVWLFGVWMTYFPLPVGPQAWVEALLSVIGTAIITAQMIHGGRDLRQERLAILRQRQQAVE